MVVLVILLVFGYIFFLHSHVIMFCDSFMAFTHENYYQSMYEQWKNKPSGFLLAQLTMFNDEPRFSTAAFILTERNEQKAIKPLRGILNSYANSKIKRAAIFRLVNLKDEQSISSFLKKAHDYRKKKLNFQSKVDEDAIDEYRNILQALASIESQETYPLLIDLVKNGTDWEKAWVLDACLFYYKSHYKSIIPIYEYDFFHSAKGAVKDNDIRGLELLGSIEAIPVLKKIIHNEPRYRKEAERAIKSLEKLQGKK